MNSPCASNQITASFSIPRPAARPLIAPQLPEKTTGKSPVATQSCTAVASLA
jgi:hypothetical protein